MITKPITSVKTQCNQAREVLGLPELLQNLAKVNLEEPREYINIRTCRVRVRVKAQSAQMRAELPPLLQGAW